MTKLASLVTEIVQQRRLGWREAKAVNTLLLRGFPSQATLDGLHHLLQGIGSQHITLDLGRHDHDVTTSVRLWQLYVINYSKVGSAPSLSGVAAACPLP